MRAKLGVGQQTVGLYILLYFLNRSATVGYTVSSSSLQAESVAPAGPFFLVLYYGGPN